MLFLSISLHWHHPTLTMQSSSWFQMVRLLSGKEVCACGSVPATLVHKLVSYLLRTLQSYVRNLPLSPSAKYTY